MALDNDTVIGGNGPVAEWRGRISERVRFHDDQLTGVHNDLRQVWQRLETVGRALTTLDLGVKNLRDDVTEALTTLDANKKQEFDDIKDALELKRGPSRRELFLYIACPILVGIAVGIILLLITGSAHPYPIAFPKTH